MTRWEVTSCTFEALEGALEDGFEPFAVVYDPKADGGEGEMIYYLKREVA